MKAVWWIKRDIRISDNKCISQADNGCVEILPFFCWEPDILNFNDFSSFHLQAQWQALAGLEKRLINLGAGMRVVSGEITKKLDELYRLYPFSHLYSHQETGNLISFARDKKVKAWCKYNRIEWIEYSQNSVVRGGNADTRRKGLVHSNFRGRPLVKVPSVFTNSMSKSFYKPLQNWSEICKSFPKFSGCSNSKSLQRVDEKNGLETLHSFLTNRGKNYAGGISSPNTAFTYGSRLSSHLAWGTISLRTVFSELDSRRRELANEEKITGWKRSLRSFESRLHWRDHFIQRLESSPDMEDKVLNPAYDSLEYEDRNDLLEAWLKGSTGYPMVDACMRCLNETGFLNFRMRAMVVSFACFGLHLSWRLIHMPLAKLFLDYEPGIHLSQLQMQAGVIGFNAIRVYNPAKQFSDHDSNGEFVKRWVPELRDLKSVEILNIEKLNLPMYVNPIACLKSRSRVMKDRIFEIRRSEQGFSETKKILKKHGSLKSVRKKTTAKQTSQLELAINYEV